MDCQFGIHGVNLREEIERYVKEPKDERSREIFGIVGNLKDRRVEVICKGSDIDQLHNALVLFMRSVLDRQ